MVSWREAEGKLPHLVVFYLGSILNRLLQPLITVREIRNLHLEQG
jgi:hypothetical protein